MIKRKGDLFTTDAPAIGHGVNVQSQMGAGIAKIFKEKYPKNFIAYRNACDVKFLQAGETLVFKENGVFIANIASQHLPGANATYPHVFSATLDAALQFDAHDIHRLAIPLIGCGIGGLEWEGVEYLLRAVESIVPDFEFEVWKP